MNRASRRSAAERAEALLAAGRTQHALDYDVEVGLARHHERLRSEAPTPEWASAGVATASKSLVVIVIKTIVSAVLVGTLAIAARQARERSQPSAAGNAPFSQDSPSVPRAPAAEAEPSLQPRPIPASDQVLPSVLPEPRTVRAEVPDKHTTRSQQASKAARAPVEPAAARGELAKAAGAVSARAELPIPSAEAATAARVEHAPSAATVPGVGTGHEGTHEVEAAASARKPTSARAEPGHKAREPDDLIEMQQVATAEQLLERAPERALALVGQGDRRFADGYFRQERAYIAIMALIRLGRVEEARARAARFANQFPALPYGARIHKALEAAP